MAPTLILLSGSINSGKSTVGRALSRLLPNTAHIEPDALRDFVDWMPLKEAIPVAIECAVRSAAVFLEGGMNVVLSYPLSRAEYELIASRLAALSGGKVHFFSLNPPIETALMNRGGRELDDWERDRIRYHYSIRLNDPGFGSVIDNSRLSAEETARVLWSAVARQ